VITLINKKAFILSLDVAIGVILVFILLTGSSFFFLRANEDFIPNLQMLRFASDVVTVLDADGTLKTFDNAQIKSGMISLLPENYGMRITINSTYSNNLIIAETDTAPLERRFIISGKRFFYASSGTVVYPSLASFEVWQE